MGRILVDKNLDAESKVCMRCGRPLNKCVCVKMTDEDIGRENGVIDTPALKMEVDLKKGTRKVKGRWQKRIKKESKKK